ncbi:MAG: hypothetical protein KME27_10745 [Lyngbya sp. HA4199-MV5]|jgi:hypothetical protein|nr:hypothetical protein [Lyngbya sp. HA4199-MV5]
MRKTIGTLVIVLLLFNLMGSGTVKLSVDVAGTVKVLWNVATFILTGQTRPAENRNPVPPNGVE